MRAALVSHRAPQALIDLLEEAGWQTIRSMPNRQVDPRVSDHPDLFVFADGPMCIVDPAHLDHYRSALPDADWHPGTASAFSPYPAEARYNAWVVAGTLVHGSMTDPEILARFDRRIEVRQGYVRCNLLELGDGIWITSDPGIQRALSSIADVRLIQPGSIALEGFPTGFIGGCGGRDPAGRLFLSGDPSDHPDHDLLIAWIRETGNELRYPEGLPLRDLGSIIFISTRRQD